MTTSTKPGQRYLSTVSLSGLLLAALLAACATAPGHDTQARHAAPLVIRVMSFNIEWGGTQVSFDKVVEAIRRAEADIVGIQEAEGNLERLAAALGWHHDRRAYVISRFPIVDPPGAAGQYVFVEVLPSRMVVIANVHLPSDPYGPYAVRDGAPPAAVLDLEQTTRIPFIQKTLAALRQLVANSQPVFVTGDFNAPAHTDWTAATAAVRDSVPYPLAWPVSVAMTVAGFRDSWRDFRPDPVADPGFTWWAGRPPVPRYVLGEDDPHDRIDFVWCAGPATVRDSIVVGETGAQGVTIGIVPWPSDHRAVVSEFEVVPTPVPDLVTTGRRVYHEGSNIDIVHFLRTGADLLVTRTGDPSFRNVRRTVDGNDRISLRAGELGPGRYALRATLSDGRALPAREFWILPRAATATIEVAGNRFDRNTPIDLYWRNAPGHRNDYLAIYPATEAPSENGDPVWIYLDARPEGHVRLDATSTGRRWPLPRGRYVAWLMKDDGYEPLARSSAFDVR